MGFRQRIEIKEGRLTFLFDSETVRVVVEGTYERGEVFVESVDINGEISLPLLEEVISSIYHFLPQEETAGVYTAESSMDD